MTQKHILVDLWLIHVDTWQKTTKFCKAITEIKEKTDCFHELEEIV